MVPIFSGNSAVANVPPVRGHGGHLIVIVPDLDLVVVATSYDFGDDFSDAPLEHEKSIMRLIATDVIPAVD